MQDFYHYEYIAFAQDRTGPWLYSSDEQFHFHYFQPGPFRSPTTLRMEIIRPIFDDTHYCVISIVHCSLPESDLPYRGLSILIGPEKTHVYVSRTTPLSSSQLGWMGLVATGRSLSRRPSASQINIAPQIEMEKKSKNQKTRETKVHAEKNSPVLHTVSLRHT